MGDERPGSASSSGRSTGDERPGSASSSGRSTGDGEPPVDLRRRLAVALDVDDVVAAERLVREVSPWFGVAKIGLELFTAAGVEAVSMLGARDVGVFLDLKLHDIPTTVERACRVIGSLGVSYVTMHASGGVPMLRAGVEGLAAGAARAGVPVPIALAVTVLTSDAAAPEHVLPARVEAAVAAGCGGIVCAAEDVRRAKGIAPHLVAVVPGIRPHGSPAHDQARASLPRAALDAGADVLVIGRAVTAAQDRAGAAAALVRSLGG